MPYNGLGLFQRLYSWTVDAAASLNILADRMDNDTDDIAAGLSNCVTRDGQSAWLDNLPAGGYKITGMGVGSADNDSVNYGQVFKNGVFLNASSSNVIPLGDSSQKYATTAFVAGVALLNTLPGQTGHTDEFLTTDGGTPGVASFSPLLKTATIRFADSADTTKRIAFNLAGISPGATRTITVPNMDVFIGSPYLKVSDRKAQGTSGGLALAGYQTRVLNTVEENSIPGASLAANQVTLPAGKFIVRGRAPASYCNNHRVALFNVTDGVYSILGSNAYTDGVNSVVTQTDSTISGVLTITSPKVFNLQHNTKRTSASANLGYEMNLAGQMELYSELEFIQIG